MDTESAVDRIVFRCPVAGDGVAVHEIVRRNKPLDENSLYCNLLQCAHFSETSAVAELNAEIVGFATGYLVPTRKDTLFIWQIAVDKIARGRGLARRLVQSVLGRPVCKEVAFIETTIMPENSASLSVFYGLAKELNASWEESVMFDKERHFKGLHDTEVLLRIGPFTSPQQRKCV